MCVENVKAQVFKKPLFKKKHFNTKDSTEVQSKTYERADWKKIEFDFLNSYYSQDGNNGAVTGGIGTEQLTDFTQKLIVKYPLNKSTKLNVDVAYDYYTSASTDNINNIRSSDSAADIRSQLGMGIERSFSDQVSGGFRLGTSVEYDYTSFHGGAYFNHISKDGNTSISVNGQAFVDQWMIIFPVELRGRVSLPTDKRQSYNGAIGFNKVLSKRMQFSLMAETTYMKGLLSTPFHRVYFANRDLADIERLPSSRLKNSLGTRINYYASNNIILRGYYRYYWDDWGMDGHTFNFEMPVKLNRFFSIYPHYRFHTQTAVDHFAPYREHLFGDQVQGQFYTSDFDLSELQSHTYGLGLLYSPASPIASIGIPFAKRKLQLEAIDLKGSIYDRSTGLKGWIVSMGFKMSF